MKDELEIGSAGIDCGGWKVFARNRRVLKDWNNLVERAPEAAESCYKRLTGKPLERIPGRVFPLKGRKYAGSWEFEVTGSDRVFYTPDEQSKVVEIYYAGKHITPVPFPPR